MQIAQSLPVSDSETTNTDTHRLTDKQTNTQTHTHTYIGACIHTWYNHCCADR